MAKQQPKKRSTPRRKSSTASRKRGKNQPGTILVLLLIVVAAIVLSYFVTGGNYSQYFKRMKETITTVSDSGNEQTADNQSSTKMTESADQSTEKLPAQKDKPLQKTALEGTWVSTLNGAMLTFKDNTFQVEFPSIEERPKLKGHFKISANSLHLVNTLSDDLCGMKEGVYSFEIKGDDLILSAQDDLCKMRKENLSTDWFKL
ncbi:MAG: hypothetical protein K8F24_01670 [Bacteroidales bacterium]|nr:hypothetical protein [Bacteroidales bacterium]